MSKANVQLTHYVLKPQLFLDPQNPEAVTANIELDTLHCPPAKTLQAWYEAIDCNTVDIVTLRLADAVVDIVVDDEGLLKPNNAPQATILGYVITDDMGYEYPLAGTLVFAGVDQEDGETVDCPLTRDQIQQLIDEDRIRTVGLNSPYN